MLRTNFTSQRTTVRLRVQFVRSARFFRRHMALKISRRTHKEIKNIGGVRFYSARNVIFMFSYLKTSRFSQIYATQLATVNIDAIHNTADEAVVRVLLKRIANIIANI